VASCAGCMRVLGMIEAVDENWKSGLYWVGGRASCDRCVSHLEWKRWRAFAITGDRAINCARSVSLDPRNVEPIAPSSKLSALTSAHGEPIGESIACSPVLVLRDLLPGGKRLFGLKVSTPTHSTSRIVRHADGSKRFKPSAAGGNGGKQIPLVHASERARWVDRHQ